MFQENRHFFLFCLAIELELTSDEDQSKIEYQLFSRDRVWDHLEIRKKEVSIWLPHLWLLRKGNKNTSRENISIWDSFSLRLEQFPLERKVLEVSSEDRYDFWQRCIKLQFETILHIIIQLYFLRIHKYQVLPFRIHTSGNWSYQQLNLSSNPKWLSYLQSNEIHTFLIRVLNFW